MQLDLEYGRSSWDDYEFDINEGKSRISRTPNTALDKL